MVNRYYVKWNPFVPNSARQGEFTERKSSHTAASDSRSGRPERQDSESLWLPSKLQSVAFTVTHVTQWQETIEKLVDRTFLGRCRCVWPMCNEMETDACIKLAQSAVAIARWVGAAGGWRWMGG